jgi:hypothetical protein
MPLTLAGRSIDQVEIVDDEPGAREAYGWTIGDAGLRPHEVQGPLRDLDAVAREVRDRGDAALCDQLLKKRNYSTFNGAELVARLYELQVPTVLCTAWEDQMLDDIRPLRRWIPVLMRPDELDDESLPNALERCIEELDHGLPAHRRPWRAQIHVIDLEADRGRVYVQVPAWGEALIRVGTHDVPEEVQRELKPDYRCHARVNLGAESLHELYFYEWEPSGE